MYDGKKAFKSALIFNVLLLIGVTIYVFWSGNSGSVITQVNEDLFGIATDSENLFISMSDITYVELVDSIDLGDRADEETEGKVYSGTYNNSEYGEFKMMAYKDSEEFVVVYYADGVLVYSLSDEDNTEESYEELAEALGLEVID